MFRFASPMIQILEFLEEPSFKASFAVTNTTKHDLFQSRRFYETRMPTSRRQLVDNADAISQK